MPPSSRREFLRHLFLAASGAAAAPFLSACTNSVPGAAGGPGNPAIPPLAGGGRLSDLGPLLEPDANGIRIPAGCSTRILAVSGEAVGARGYVWHPSPDGGATFPAADGGWVYTSNSEITPGGCGALRFNAAGEVVDAYRILDGTSNNCAGGRMPWGTWMSCEETQQGRVWECNPFGTAAEAVVHPLLGTFSHEGVEADPVHRQLFLTEDIPVGRFYRFVPTDADWPEGAARPALQAGQLQAMQIVGSPAPTTPTSVIWHPIAQPTVAPTAAQAPQATAFNGGEGIWYYQGIVFFSTKGDNRIWAYDTDAETIEIIYDRATSDNPILSGVDNVTVSSMGDVLVAEDGGDMQIGFITPDRQVLPLLQVIGQDASEITGPAFSPDGRRLYFSSQRGGRVNGSGAGITYELLLPFAA